MCEYYYDDDHGVAYKVNPVEATTVNAEGQEGLSEILVHTDVKVTNLKKEKVRRTLSESYPTDRFDLDTARNLFKETILAKLVWGTRQITEEEYSTLRVGLEAQFRC